MRIGVPRESRPGERRVAATPKTVEQIRALGYAVFVESGAGLASSFDDAAYQHAGADVIDEAVWNADVLLKIKAEDPELVRGAPHTHVVSRPDEVKAAKEPVLRWTAGDATAEPLADRKATTGSPAGAP